MSEISKKNIVKYMLDKTHKTFEEAILLAQNEYWDTVINRLYYSSFYAVKAYLDYAKKLRQVRIKRLKCFTSRINKNKFVASRL